MKFVYLYLHSIATSALNLHELRRMYIVIIQLCSWPLAAAPCCPLGDQVGWHLPVVGWLSVLYLGAMEYMCLYMVLVLAAGVRRRNPGLSGSGR